jgi:hypothetical protein
MLPRVSVSSREFKKWVARFSAALSLLKKARQPFEFSLFVDGGRQFVNLRADVGAQQLEGGDGCERDERCRNGVFRQLKTGFIAKESLNHLVLLL